MTQFAFPMTGLDSGWPDGSDGWGNSFRSNMAVLQALTRRRAINRTTNTPPGSPAAGDCYIIGAAPTGAWAGKTKQIAIYGELWYYIIPEVGLSDFYDLAIGRWYRYNGSTWGDVFVAETQLSIKGVQGVTMPASGTLNLTRAQAASTVFILVGTPATPPVTLQWMTADDDVIPADITLWAGYCAAPTIIKSETLPGSSFVLVGGGTANLFASPVGGLWGDFINVFNYEVLSVGPRFNYYASGGLITLDGVADRGKVQDIGTGYTTVKPPNNTNFADANNCVFYVNCQSADGVTIVPDTGSTLYGPTELTKGDFAIVQRDISSNDYRIRIIQAGPSFHKGITAQSGTTYTIDRFDRGTVIKFSNAADVAVTVPALATNDMGEDCIVHAVSTGAGGLHFVPDTGVTLEGNVELLKGEEAILRRQGVTNTWRITILSNKGRHVGVTAQAGATYTLARADRGSVVKFSNAADVAVTIPDSSNTDMGEDCICHAVSTGAGGFHLVPDTGVTLEGPLDVAKGEEAVLRREGTTDTWRITILTNKGRHAGIYDDSTTAYTLGRKNKGQLVNCTNAAAVALTIPDSSNVEMGEDCECWVRAEGAAGVTLTPDTGVTIKGPTAMVTDDVAHLRRVGATDTWITSI